MPHAVREDNEGWLSGVSSVAAGQGGMSRSSSSSSIGRCLHTIPSTVDATGVAPAGGPWTMGVSGPLLDLDSLLRRLLQEPDGATPATVTSNAAALLTGPLYEYGARHEPAPTGLEICQSPTAPSMQSHPRSPPDAVLQLSPRSGTDCISGHAGSLLHSQGNVRYLADVHSDAGMTSSADGIQEVRAESSSMPSDEDLGPSDEVVSVLHATDEPASSHAAGEEDSEDERSAIPLSGAASSQVSASPRVWRSAMMTHEAAAAEALFLQGTLSNMLLRFTEDSTLEESAVASVRRVLQLGAVLTGHKLSDEEIRDLPKVRFDAEEQQHCAICLESYQVGELLTSLRCNHFFHVECLKDWMQRSTQCPLCRHECGPSNIVLE